MPTFRFTDMEHWCLIFGHIIEYQHKRWDSKYRGKEERINLAKLATALNNVVPCQALTVLRTRLHEKCHTLPKAWVQITGKENVDEISRAQWQKGLRQFDVTAKDASQLYALFCAMPSLEHHSDEHLSRSIFLASLKGPAPDANARMLELLVRLGAEHGPASRAFEKEYPRDPLPADAFQEQTSRLLSMSAADSRVIFLHLSLNRDGRLAIDELLDALTVMQATYLPYGTPRPVQANHTADQPAETKDADSSAASDKADQDTSDSKPTNTSPGDIHNISTTLPPDSDDDSGSASAADTQQARPRTVPSGPGVALSTRPGEEFGHSPSRRLVGGFHGSEPGALPVLDLAGWHQRDHRPMTTDTATRSSFKGSEQGAPMSSRPAPLAMALRRMVEDRNHAHDLQGPSPTNPLQSIPLQKQADSTYTSSQGLHRDSSLVTLTSMQSDDTSTSRQSVLFHAAGAGLPSMSAPLVLNGASSWRPQGDSEGFATPKRETRGKILGGSPRMPHTGAKAPIARERVTLQSLGASAPSVAKLNSDSGFLDIHDDPVRRHLTSVTPRQLPGLTSPGKPTSSSPGKTQARQLLENSVLAQTLAAKAEKQQQKPIEIESGPQSQLAMALASRLGSSQGKEGGSAAMASARKSLARIGKSSRGSIGETAASAAAASLLKGPRPSGLP